MNDIELTPAAPPAASRPERRLPASVVTHVIIAVNVAIFVWMVARGVGLMSPDGEVIVKWGANYAPLVAAGEWWRLAVCMFLHAGILHVGMNMWALRVLGPPVEILFGRVPFAILYLLSGLGGSIASCLWHPSGVSVGASGAIFGLPGAIVAYFLMHRSGMQPGLFRAQMKSMATFIGINVLIGLSIPQVDLSAHVGGLVTGFACGLAAGSSTRRSSAIDKRQLARLALVSLLLAALLPLVRSRVRNDAVSAPEYWLIRGERALEARDWTAVRAAAEGAIAATPDSSYGFELRARAALAGEAPDDALPDLDTSIQLDPDATRAHMMRGWLRSTRGDQAGAILDLRRAMDAGSVDPLGLEFHGKALFGLEQWKPALRDFESSSRLPGRFASEAPLYAWLCRMHLGLRDAATREIRSAVASGAIGSGWERSVAEYLADAIPESEFRDRLAGVSESWRAEQWIRERSSALAAEASAR